MDPNTRGPVPPRKYEELSVGRALRLYARGLTLRCPHCGKSVLLRTWFKLKAKCPSCGLRTDRGEEDFFLGGIMLNYVLCGLVFMAAVVLVLVVTWPDVPWDLLQWGGLAFIAVLPFFFYPFSLTAWLASDILIKPVTDAEMEWHHASKEGEFRRHRDR